MWRDMSNIYYLHVISVTIDGSKGVIGGISGDDGWCKRLSNTEGWITPVHP